MNILMTLLVAGSLSAQEREEVNARVILFGEAIQTRGILLANGVKDQANWQTGPGIRIMGQVAMDSPWCWEVAGRFLSNARMVTDRDISSTPPANVLNVTKTKIRYGYWSVGGGYLLPLGQAVDFGVHLEGRGETINPQGDYSTTSGGAGYIDAHTVYFRPWVRLSLDLKFKTGSIKTIIGGDVAAAAIKTDQRVIQPMSELDSQTLRALAPTWSGSLYAGFQF
jgi:hypothetical protein